MAFKVRVEFWELSSTADGVSTVVLKKPISGALEFDVDMQTGEPVALPVLSNRSTYAMSVYGVAGSATVEVAETPTEAAGAARLVTESSQHWFLVDPDSSIFIKEYGV